MTSTKFAQTGTETEQALTAAISPKGLTTFFSQAITLLMQQSFTAPDKPHLLSGQNVPLIPCTMWLADLSLSGGVVSQLKTLLTSVTQKSGGIFTIALNGSFHVGYTNWYEKGGIDCPRPCPQCDNPHTDFDQTLSGFGFNIDSIDLSFDVTIAGVGAAWHITVANAGQNNIVVGAVNLPGNSELNTPSVFKCINDKISEKMADTIRGVDFAGNLQNALAALLNTIPNSGKLTDHITYYFPPTFVNFPDDKGISAGVTGQVKYDQDFYSGQAATVAAAAMDSTRDITINIGTYEFNALLWAFNKSGFLNFTLLPSMLPDPAVLNTTFYKSYLPQLYNFAPGAFMSVGVTTKSDPVVTNSDVFWLNTSILTTLKGVIPDTAYNILAGVPSGDPAGMIGVMYPDKSSFEQALQGTISAADFTQCVTTIEDKSKTTGMKVATSLTLVVNVKKQGTDTFAFSFDITKNDIMSTYQLTIAGSVQSLKFVFSEFATTAVVVNSAIGDISPLQLNLLWAVAGLKVNDAIQKAGTTGIPLPFIKGFLFVGSVITLQDNYLSLAANLSFGALNNLQRAHVENKESHPCICPVKIFHLQKGLNN